MMMMMIYDIDDDTEDNCIGDDVRIQIASNACITLTVAL
jgi:hypothetical protein